MEHAHANLAILVAGMQGMAPFRAPSADEVATAAAIAPIDTQMETAAGELKEEQAGEVKLGPAVGVTHRVGSLEQALLAQQMQATVIRRNDRVRMRNARTGALDRLELLEKEEMHDDGAPVGALPGADVPFPATRSAANELTHPDVDALAAFYQVDFGTAGQHSLPARRLRFCDYIGL